MNIVSTYNGLAAKLDRLSKENAVLRANVMAWPQFAPVGSKQAKYGFMTIEADKAGFTYPPIARQYGFMANPSKMAAFSEYKATAEPEGFMHTARDRDFGFMGNTAETMQTAPCECQSFSNGFSTGMGIAVGAAVVAAAAAGIWSLIKNR